MTDYTVAIVTCDVKEMFGHQYFWPFSDSSLTVNQYMIVVSTHQSKSVVKTHCVKKHHAALDFDREDT